MNDWKQQIEAQIAWIDRWPCVDPNCTDGAIPHGPTPDGYWEAEQCQFCYEKAEIRKSLQALLDVAVAAEDTPQQDRSFAMDEALDKLREVGDE